MPETRRFLSDYSPKDVALVQAATLSIFRILGALADELTIVGGFVPYLLINQDGLEAAEAHPGTQDLDLVLQLTLLDEERYKEVSKCLRESGFRAVEKEPGKHRFQQWIYAQDVARISARICRQANAHVPDTEKLHLTPHMLRHTFLKRVADKYGVHVAQQMSGNISIREVFRYTKPTEVEMEMTAEELFQ